MLVAAYSGRLCFAGFVVFVRRQMKLRDLPLARFTGSAAILCCSLLLVFFYVPRRIAFLASRSSFEALVDEAPLREVGGTALNRRLGVYRVEDYAMDPRGGVYFRVYRGAEILDADHVSYGFAYNPNRKGSPFGDDEYLVRRITDRWFWFRAADY
jgi:hypothetical protein